MSHFHINFYEISYREGARRGGCGTKILPKEVSGQDSLRRIWRVMALVQHSSWMIWQRSRHLGQHYRGWLDRGRGAAETSVQSSKVVCPKCRDLCHIIQGSGGSMPRLFISSKRVLSWHLWGVFLLYCASRKASTIHWASSCHWLPLCRISVIYHGGRWSRSFTETIRSISQSGIYKRSTTLILVSIGVQYRDWVWYLQCLRYSTIHILSIVICPSNSFRCLYLHDQSRNQPVLIMECSYSES